MEREGAALITMLKFNPAINSASQQSCMAIKLNRFELQGFSDPQTPDCNHVNM